MPLGLTPPRCPLPAAGPPGWPSHCTPLRLAHTGCLLDASWSCSLGPWALQSRALGQAPTPCSCAVYLPPRGSLFPSPGSPRTHLTAGMLLGVKFHVPKFALRSP